MNKQAIGQPMKVTPAQRGESPQQAESKKETKESSGASKRRGVSEESAFESQLTQAGLLAQQTPLTPQPLPLPMGQGLPPQQLVPAQNQVQSKEMANAQGTTAPSASALTNVAQMSPLTLKTAVSTNTVSAMTGLKPGSNDWVSQAEGTEPTAKQDETPSLPAAQGASEKGAARPKRGDADAALISKLDAALSQLMSFPAKGTQPSTGAIEKEGAEAQSMQDQQQPLLMSGTDGAAAGNALEAQMASMGGVIQGSKQTVPQAKSGKPQGNALNSALSGGEFLTTLSAVKGGAASPSRPDQGDQAQEFGGKGGGMSGKLETKSNLRVIDGGMKGKKSFGETLDMNRADQLGTSQSLNSLATGGGKAGVSALATEVTGHVTKGANAEDRLSSESLTSVSSGIRDLAPQGGGEMRIRLRPENLGELHIRVVTDGRNVGLHVQASDERAKKIIEESMSHLKDSLASQSLSLGTVDFSVAQSKNGAALDQRNDQGQSGNHGQGMFQDTLGQNAGNSNQNSGRGAWNGFDNETGTGYGQGRMTAGSSTASMASRLGADARRTAAAYDSGRLDVKA